MLNTNMTEKELILIGSEIFGIKLDKPYHFLGSQNSWSTNNYLTDYANRKEYLIDIEDYWNAVEDDIELLTTTDSHYFECEVLALELMELAWKVKDLNEVI